MQGGIAIGNHDGALNYNQDPVDKSVKVGGNVGNLATGDSHSGSMTANMGAGQDKTAKKKDLKDCTVDDIQNLLQENGFPKSVLKTFKDNKIDGEFFGNIDDSVFKELGVESALDKMKIRTLQKSLQN